MSNPMMKTWLLVFAFAMWGGAAAAQDVPGIEICTVEKTMERRTSCLQSNVDFLKKTMTKDTIDHQKKLDTAVRELDALKSQVEALKTMVAALQKRVEQAPVPDQKAKDFQGKDLQGKDAPAK